jgi:hypothetical protein
VPESSRRLEPPARNRSVRARRQDLAWRRAGDEGVVLDVANSTYRALNTTGALLWEQLADWVSPEALTAVLVDHYGITSEAASRDVVLFLDDCVQAGLLETVDRE